MGMSADWLADPQAEAHLASVKALLDDVNAEDKGCTEKVYRGLLSGLASPGPLSHLERPNFEFCPVPRQSDSGLMTGPAPLRDDFLRGMSHAAATVNNIIATDGPAGRAGVTVSAMSSVSADTPKPTLLTCVHHMSPAAQKIIDNGCFTVNVLRDDQSYISDTFAGRFKDQVADKFDCCDWAAMETCAPRVVDPLVLLDCRVVSSERIGTHHVFFGEAGVFTGALGSPLIYAHRAYASHSLDRGRSLIGAGRAAARRLHIGCFHTFGPYLLPEMPARLVQRT